MDEIEALIDDVIAKAMSEAQETGPDRDYRRFAHEETEEAKKALLDAVKKLTEE